MFDFDEDHLARPPVPTDTVIIAQRNPIPFFGAGVMAEITDAEILSREDPDDADGDGISGRANFDRGFVGRFGRKAQTGSIEAFIRGPLFNHAGITTAPLTNDQRALLPIAGSTESAKVIQTGTSSGKRGPHMQIGAPDTTNRDDDGVPDPELSGGDLFDLISFAMLLAAPELDELTEQGERGRVLFHEAGCAACHTPRINGPRGPLPIYSDLLLHDMGAALADGLVMGVATGFEFRTQPLWGIASVGPYLHDGRAETLEDAIDAHGGEGEASRDAFAAFTSEQRGDVVEFLLSLGGRDQYSTGLLEPNAPIPGVGEYGGPFRDMSDEEQARFIRGREVFDRDFGHRTGIGALASTEPGAGQRFNGDGCRACHTDPVIGGSGPRDVNVMRHGRMEPDGTFAAPMTTPNTILHKQIRVGYALPEPGDDINVLEHRQTPSVLGLGLVDAIDGASIMANADESDDDGDGISGRAHVMSDGQVGRLGWKAQVPSVAEFVRDAMAAEVGLTLPEQDGLTFGITSDTDDAGDPELSLSEVEDIAFFISMLAPPPRQPAENEAMVAAGEALFDTVGCAKCHIPSLPSSLGDVPLYSDLLLHDILPEGSPGIADGMATATEFRTALLWGLSTTAPYSHTGEADTIDEAIRLHDGEAAAIRNEYTELSEEDRAALLAFLGTL